MKLAIVGPGLIGRSVALAAKRAAPDTEIVEIDREDAIAAAAVADLIVLAAPVDAILDILLHHADLLRPVVTLDTGSTKTEIVASARRLGLDRFVGGHPMAGAATSGPAAARADLFDGRAWFLVTRGADASAVEQATSFVRMLGARPVTMGDGGEEHDRAIAAVSHLPQVVASVLMGVVGDAAGDRLSWAGGGLRDTTRLAASSVAMWESVLKTNASELRPLLLDVAARLTQIAHELGDAEEVRRLFAKANHYRALL